MPDESASSSIAVISLFIVYLRACHPKVTQSVAVSVLFILPVGDGSICRSKHHAGMQTPTSCTAYPQITETIITNPDILHGLSCVCGV
jgi:hypothetical protein